MHRDRPHLLLLLGGAALCGWIGWSGEVLLLPVAAVFPALWSGAKTRWQAALISACYFLAASRGLPPGVATFYAADLFPGLLLWVIASSVFVCVHALCWANTTALRLAFRYVGACAVMAVPPAGILGWAHPVTAAGAIFPGWGWAGLVAMLIAVVLMTTRYRLIAGTVLSGLWIWSAIHWTPPIAPAGWQGVDLHLGASLGRDQGMQRQQHLVSLARGYAPGGVVVFPESALGFWTPTSSRFWQKSLEHTDTTIIAGAAAIDESGYDNVLVRITAAGADIIYRERMPVPGAMWQPWSGEQNGSGGARAYVFANPAVLSGSARVAPLICYEQLIVWPVLHSMLHDPDIIIAVGNGWWTTGTSIVAIQRAATQAWARLFDKPLVTSFNT
ncbi:conjugal transfer protein TraB [Rhizobiales bacterium RZME27]|uniref:Conjugal transfer protein TraB n=1 Tax=Endobacterium cereale TaxID=2663029 RepID=A0A6A8A5V0_9HYPH|nr:conjugal transfer protein TraB [Endobacterium cereale]MEB2846622.1 conjugal transfer protein TraB [Endobacterium cereale]MQY46453.1 conjugal transfer protein TraB [Endobacterium cereale]